MLKSMRISLGLGETIPNVSDSRAPIVPAVLESAEQMIIRGDRLAIDAPGRTAIREWVLNGGRLWIMLDTMDELTVQRLLGDSCRIEYVDRIGLTSFRSEYTDPTLIPEKTIGKLAGSNLNAPSIQEHEYPVQFVRAIVEDCETIATITGWPSIFKMDFGQGTIVFTTIGARALSRVRKDGENPRGMEKAFLLPQPELVTIADILFAKKNTPIAATSTFAPLVEHSIGYQVPGRSMILLILGAFCVSLVLIGVWLSKTNRLGQLVWIAPAAALLATVPLVAIGAASKRTVPPTVVETQFIDATPSGDDLFVQGLAGVYHNSAGDRKFVSNSSSVFFPDRTGINGTWRMVWKDLDQWQWENVTMPSGLRLVPFSSTIHETDPMRAYGSFGPQGFYGELDCPLTNLRDAIIASSTHVSLAIDLQDEKILGPVENSLAPGQYIANSLLSDEQIQHQEVYRSMMDFDLGLGINIDEHGEVLLIDSATTKADAEAKKSQSGELESGPTRKFPNHPSLLAWADPIDVGFEFSDDLNKKGSALVVMPITLVRPEPHKKLRIPSVFLPYDAVFSPNNEGKSIAYNSQLGTWPKRSLGTKSTLRFQLPECVLPFEPSAARLRIKINAAKRNVDIKTGAIDSLFDVGNTDEALGELTYRIVDPDGLKLDADGGFHVRIAVGEIDLGDGAHQNAQWKIDYVELEIEGKHLPLD